MPKRDDDLLYKDIVQACNHIQDFIAGLSKEAFIKDYKTQCAVMKLLEIIGEASTHLSPEAKSASPTVPWREIVGMRNILVHVYHDIDAGLVWDTVIQYVPELKMQVMTLLVKK